MADQTHPLIGKIISINLKAINYFGVGGPGSKDAIWLTPEIWWDTVPPGLAPSELLIIEKNLQEGKLFLGKIKTRAKKLDSKILSNYAELLKNASGNVSDPRNKAFTGAIIRLTSKHEDGGYQTRYIIDQLIKMEQRGKQRKDVLRVLEEAKRIIAGKFFQYEEEVYDEEAQETYSFEAPKQRTIPTPPTSSAIKEEPASPSGKTRGRKRKVQ